MRSMILTAAGAALLFASVATAAPPCKDARGKFIKCAPAAAAKPTRCKDAKGKFMKCGLPGALPA